MLSKTLSLAITMILINAGVGKLTNTYQGVFDLATDRFVTAINAGI